MRRLRGRGEELRKGRMREGRVRGGVRIRGMVVLGIQEEGMLGRWSCLLVGIFGIRLVWRRRWSGIRIRIRMHLRREEQVLGMGGEVGFSARLMYRLLCTLSTLA
jgi:hypothetical protein